MEDDLVIRIEDQKELELKIRKKQDEFLDVYSLYRKTGLEWIKQEAILKAYELHLLDTKFSVEI